MLLRIEIDEAWEAADFAVFFENIQDLSYLLIAGVEYRYRQTVYSPNLASLKRRNATLTVRAIKFNSPGFTDLAGFGAIISTISDFIQFAVKHFSERQDRKLSREEKKLDILKKKIDILKNLDEYPELLENPAIIGFLENDRADHLLLAVSEQRIKSAKLINDEQSNGQS